MGNMIICKKSNFRKLITEFKSKKINIEKINSYKELLTEKEFNEVKEYCFKKDIYGINKYITINEKFYLACKFGNESTVLYLLAVRIEYKYASEYVRGQGIVKIPLPDNGQLDINSKFKIYTLY